MKICPNETFYRLASYASFPFSTQNERPLAIQKNIHPISTPSNSIFFLASQSLHEIAKSLNFSLSISQAISLPSKMVCKTACSLFWVAIDAFKLELNALNEYNSTMCGD